MEAGLQRSLLALLALLALSVLLLLGPAVSSNSSSTAGTRLAHGQSTASAGRKPRVRYIFAAVGSEATSLVFGAAIDTGGLDTTYYMEYGTSPEYGSRAPTETLSATPRPDSGNPTTGEVRVTVTGLTPATSYHYRLVLGNALGSAQSSDRTVLGGGRAPRISGVFTRDGRKPTSVFLGATIDTGGLATTYHVEYGPAYRLKTADTMLQASPSPGSWAPTKRGIRTPLSALEPGRHYLARIVASNVAGEISHERDVVSGRRKSGVSSPVVEIGSEPTSVVFRATIDTGRLPTTYYVEYGTRPSYGSRTPKRKLSAVPGQGWSPTSKEIQVSLSGLTPATTYYYRIVATNAAVRKLAGRTFVSGGSKPRVSYLFVGPGSNPSSVSFGAGIDTGGLPTTYYAEYGPALQYDSRTPSATFPPLPSRASFRPTVTELRTGEVAVTGGATYHYRIVASNAVGTTSSSDRTFTVR